MTRSRYKDTLSPAEYVKHLEKWRKKRGQSKSPYYFAVKKRIERGDTAVVSSWRGDLQRFSLDHPGHLPKGSSAQAIASYVVYAKYEGNNHVSFERARRDVSSRYVQRTPTDVRRRRLLRAAKEEVRRLKLARKRGWTVTPEEMRRARAAVAAHSSRGR